MNGIQQIASLFLISTTTPSDVIVHNIEHADANISNCWTGSDRGACYYLAADQHRLVNLSAAGKNQR